MADKGTLFGQLSRIATNQAVYLTLVKIIEENHVNTGDTLGSFIMDGHFSDLTLSIRRLLESNLSRGDKLKEDNKQVISIRGLVEFIGDAGLLERVKKVKLLAGESGNKVFGHNDRLHAEGKVYKLATYDSFKEAVKELHTILIDAGKKLGVDVQDCLLSTHQYDWAEALNNPWKDEYFDYSEIWDEQ